MGQHPSGNILYFWPHLGTPVWRDLAECTTRSASVQDNVSVVFGVCLFPPPQRSWSTHPLLTLTCIWPATLPAHSPGFAYGIKAAQEETPPRLVFRVQCSLGRVWLFPIPHLPSRIARLHHLKPSARAGLIYQWPDLMETKSFLCPTSLLSVRVVFLFCFFSSLWVYPFEFSLGPDSPFQAGVPPGSLSAVSSQPPDFSRWNSPLWIPKGTSSSMFLLEKHTC